MTAEGLLQHQRALAEVIADQRRQDEEQPGELDRLAAEMAHVGVERLRAGDRQEDEAEGDEAGRAIAEQEDQPGERVEGVEDARRVGDVDDAERADQAEEHHHDRAEKGRDPRRAAALHDRKG